MAKAPQRRKSAGNGRGSRPAKTPKRTIARPPRQVSETSTEGYEIICSECYSSFMMSRNPSASQVTCPDCLHVGSIAPREEMTKISIAKSAEKSNLRLAAIPALLFFLCGVTYVALLNAKGGAEELGTALNLGLLGLSLVLLIVTLATAVRYERHRYEVYF